MVTVRSTHILSRFRARVADLKSTAPDPENELGQQMYPRRHFFEQASAVMAAAGRSVPVFIDKYLAPSWEDAKWMYDRAQELEIPFMAGSSVPICFWRNTAEGEGCKPEGDALSPSLGSQTSVARRPRSGAPHRRGA